MKLDTAQLRHLSPDDWRVLTAVETGSRNHEVVPTPLIQQLASVHGSVSRSISILAKIGLIAKVKNASYDGYRLTYGGLDYLALHTYIKKGSVFSISQTPLGVGKESDIYIVATPPNVTAPKGDPEGSEQAVIKLHRLGRISFRNVKNKRDYLHGGRQAKSSWMHLSRLSAIREGQFMTALHDAGFPVPRLIGQSRHTLLMTLHRAPPLRQLQDCPDIPGLWARLVQLILKLARSGLVHGDFNEFNILCYENTTDVVLIDFPQMVSVDHRNAQEMWERDLHCLMRFFERRWAWVVDKKQLPTWEKDVVKVLKRDSMKRGKGVSDGEEEPPARLDGEVAATGFNKRQLKDLEKYWKDQRATEDEQGDDSEEEEDDEDDEDEDNEEGGALEAKFQTLDITKDTKIEMVPL
ncbi:atypical/RIO/RIO2 protein kinase [Peziza echinospora]|nr:atypical/RIO/RIO2 protein kinase [Peziza echinospora]